MATVPGTPHWAVWTARGAVLSVLPSALWRTLVGLGVPLGWRQNHLDLERIPGYGTAYVVVLSVLSIAAATLAALLWVPCLLLTLAAYVRRRVSRPAYVEGVPGCGQGGS